MVQNVIYPGEGSVCAWEKGEIHCFGVKCPKSLGKRLYPVLLHAFAKCFSTAHGTFSRIDHILGHKSSLGKLKKKIKITPSIFSDHNAVRLDLNYRRKTIKNSNIWRLNNTLLNNQQITEEIKKRNQIMHRNEWKWKHNNPKPVRHCKSKAKGKGHSNTGIPQETRKESNK